MSIKFKTIWHYAIAFFETKHAMEDAESDLSTEIFYSGTIETLGYKRASKIAQMHHSCLRYYEFTLMPLFQGKGKYSKGTENPIMALESLKTKKRIRE